MPSSIFSGFALSVRLKMTGSCILDLIAEELPKVLSVDPALGYIHHCCKAVQLCIDLRLHILHCLDHIRQLAHSGGLDQDPVRVISRQQLP